MEAQLFNELCGNEMQFGPPTLPITHQIDKKSFHVEIKFSCNFPYTARNNFERQFISIQVSPLSLPAVPTDKASAVLQFQYYTHGACFASSLSSSTPLDRRIIRLAGRIIENATDTIYGMVQLELIARRFARPSSASYKCVTVDDDGVQLFNCPPMRRCQKRVER